MPYLAASLGRKIMRYFWVLLLSACIDSFVCFNVCASVIVTAPISVMDANSSADAVTAAERFADNEADELVDRSDLNSPIAPDPSSEFTDFKETSDAISDAIPAWIARQSVILKGLDKVTAKSFATQVMLNQKVKFGTLDLYVRSIYERPPEDVPEKVVFIEIYDTPPGQKTALIFSNWMFASNTSVNALEHPVYDIWVDQ